MNENETQPITCFCRKPPSSRCQLLFEAMNTSSRNNITKGGLRQAQTR